MPATKAKRAKKPTQSIRANKSTRVTDSGPVRSVAVRATSVPAQSASPRAILFGLTGVVAVAVLIAARQPSQRADVASIGAPPVALPAAIVPPAGIVLPEPAAASARLETKKPVVPRPPATAAVVKSAAAEASIEKTAVESVRVMAIEPVSSSAPMETSANAVAELPSKAAVETVASVTITGCLANDDDTFLLKDTSGVDAPKARSWRSGFLKKRPATVELLDATNALRLPNYVGQRVAATGMLVNHEMRAQSLRRVAASCG